MKDKIFVELAIDWETNTYESYLVNPTEKNYRNVLAYTGAFCSADDELIETSRAVKELGELKPYSWVFLEGADADSFDFVIWYLLDLIPETETAPVEMLQFNFPKYGFAPCYDKIKEYLPIIEKTGAYIEVKPRVGSKTIDESIKEHRQGKRDPQIVDYRQEKQ